MSILSFIFNPRLTKFTDANGVLLISFDATPSIKYEMTSSLTKSQIENGSVIADHVTHDNKKASFDVVISNTPLTYNLISVFSGTSNSRAKDAFKFLEKLKDDSTPFNAIFNYHTYVNAILTNITVHETCIVAGALHASLTIEEAKIVSSRMVALSGTPSVTAQNITGPIQDAGKKATTPATSQNGTTASKVLSVFGLI